MSILYATGFDYFLNVDDMAEAGIHVNGTPTFNESITCSIHSRQSLRVYTNINNVSLPIFSFYEEIAYIAFWMYIPTFNSDTSFLSFNYFIPSSSQISCRFTTDGEVGFYNAVNVLLGSLSDPGVITTGNWHYIEVKGAIKASTATDDCIIRVDGVEVVNLPATTDTHYTSLPFFNNFLLRTASSQYIYFDDVIIYDTEGSTWNDFMGPRYISTLKANGTGNSTQWTRSGGAANYEMVDEVEYDDDTSYVSTSTLNNKDLYTFEDLHASVNTIDAVCVNTVARRSAGINYRTIVPVTRISSTDYDHDHAGSTMDTYRVVQKIWDESPATATAWTPSEVNAAEFGIKVKT